MKTVSAGILMYRIAAGELLVLLAHAGGPFWRQRDDGAWTIPKGAMDPVPLGAIVQRGGKRVEAFALEGNFDLDALRSNLFEIEWPPRSGRMATFPEIDRAEWLTLPRARTKILPSQSPLLDRLETLLRTGS